MARSLSTYSPSGTVGTVGIAGQSFDFKALRHLLWKAYHEPNDIKNTKFISGQEISIGTERPGFENYVFNFKNYLRCTNSRDEVIATVKSQLKDQKDIPNDDDDDRKDRALTVVSGQSKHAFNGPDNDVTIYVLYDKTDDYIAPEFKINSGCSPDKYAAFIDFICDVLTSIFQWTFMGCCNCNSLNLLGCCDFVFALLRLEMPNDIIRVVASYC